MSPFASVSAALHSIIPAPVISRSFFTIAAVISAITAPEKSLQLSPPVPRLGPPLEAGSGNWQLVRNNAGLIVLGRRPNHVRWFVTPMRATPAPSAAAGRDASGGND